MGTRGEIVRSVRGVRGDFGLGGLGPSDDEAGSLLGDSNKHGEFGDGDGLDGWNCIGSGRGRGRMRSNSAEPAASWTCAGGEGNEERDVTELTASVHFSLGAKMTFGWFDATFGLVGDEDLDCWANDGLRDRNGSEGVVVFLKDNMRGLLAPSRSLD